MAARRPFGGVMLAVEPTAAPAFAGIHLGDSQVVPVNVYDGGEDLVVQAPLPGILPEDVEVNVTEEHVSIRADLRGGETFRNYLQHEWHYGPYERDIELPYPVDGERCNISLQNGLLTISLPKSDVTRPRRIRLTGREMEGHSGHRRAPVVRPTHP